MAYSRGPGYTSACATLQQLAGRPSQRWAAACSAGSWPVVKSCMAAVVVPGGGGASSWPCCSRRWALLGHGFAGVQQVYVRADQALQHGPGKHVVGAARKPGCPCAQDLGQMGLKRLCSVRRVLLFLPSFRRLARCWLQWLGPGHRRLARANALAGHGCAAGFENGCCPPCRAWR